MMNAMYQSDMHILPLHMSHVSMIKYEGFLFEQALIQRALIGQIELGLDF